MPQEGEVRVCLKKERCVVCLKKERCVYASRRRGTWYASRRRGACMPQEGEVRVCLKKERCVVCLMSLFKILNPTYRKLHPLLVEWKIPDYTVWSPPAPH